MFLEISRGYIPDSCSQATMSSLVVMLPRGHRVKVPTNPNMALLAIKVIILSFSQFQDTAFLCNYLTYNFRILPALFRLSDNIRL